MVSTWMQVAASTGGMHTGGWFSCTCSCTRPSFLAGSVSTSTASTSRSPAAGSWLGWMVMERLVLGARLAVPIL
jgi:hypothetical protein